MLIRLGAALAAALLFSAHPAATSAQQFPQRPITIVSAFGPGSPQDLIVRNVGEELAKDVGQTVVPDNKPGGGATLAAASLLSAKPDGYTLASVVSTLVIVPQLQKTAFDPAKDFTYLAQIGAFPLGVTVKADSPFKTWADMVAFAKANPGKVTFGTPGSGTNVHLGMERIAKQSGLSLTHVPHTGAMTIIPAVLGGHVMLQASGTEWKPQVEAGQMRLLVIWSAKRHPSFPDVPTLREVGYPFDIEVPFGFVGPKGLEPAALEVLQKVLKKAIEAPSTVALLGKYDMIPNYADGAELRRRMEEVGTSMAPIIEQLGLKRKE